MDIGLGVSSLYVDWMLVELVSVVSVVLPIVVEVFSGKGVSPLIVGDVPIGSIVDSFCVVCCVGADIGSGVLWVISGVCIGVGLS